MRLIDLSTKSWVGQFPDFGLVSRLNIENAFLILRFDQNFVVFQGEILKTHLIFFPDFVDILVYFKVEY